MNERERFLKVMHFETVDSPPFLKEGIWPETYQRWHQEGLPVDKIIKEFLGLDVLELKYRRTTGYLQRQS